MEIPSIPPGFESVAPFTLKKVENSFTLKKVENHQVITYSGTIGASELRPVKLEIEMDYIDNSKNTKNHTHRARRKYNQIDSSGDESEIEQVGHKVSEGVIRACQQCTSCQKVTANWCPEEARRPDLEEAPVFYPSEEEFEDTLKYIDSIRSQAEPYGICRIVPPPSWKPPCPLKEKNIWEKAKFATRIQRIDKLQNRDSLRKIFQINNDKRRKKQRCMKAGDSNEGTEIMVEEKLHEADFGFEPGPEFTLDGFEKYANDFKSQYFMKNNCASCSRSIRTIVEEPSVENIEGEYWRMVEKPTEEIEVLYGADLETGTFGSGFPTNPQQAGSTSDMKYVNSGWNLNNFPRLPGSVLSFESSDITGVLVPWLYIGMCFSSFCWHVEDHYLYSLNYLHWGAPKIWYGVPGTYALKLEAAMRKHLPDLFEEQPDLLHKLITQLSPSILRREGVPVHRCVQKPGEFVLTFPRAYHAGFNSGFNCAEAVNVAPIDWLPYGLDAIELYQQQGRKTSISHDKLLLGAAREAVKANWECNLLRKYTSNNLRWKDVCGEDGILSKALKTRVEMERTRREFLCKSSQSLKMDCSFDANSERECSVCLFDLHLSAAGCHLCSPNKYACLNHAKQLCSCSWGAKFFLFRYDINELTILVEALEGKLSAVYRWARLDLGLALTSYVSKESKQIPKELAPKKPASEEPVLKEPAPKEMSSPPALNSSKDQENGNVVNSTEYIESLNSPEKLNPLVVVLALENVKASAKFSPQKVKSPKNCSPCEKEDPLKPHPRCKTPSLENNLASVKLEKNHSVFLEKRDVIFLSDDEGDEPVTDKYTERTQKNIYPDSMVNLDICVTNTECVEIEDNMEFEKCFNKDIQRKKETPDCDQENSNAGIKPQEIIDNTRTNVDIHIKLEPAVDLKSMDSVQTVSCSPSGLHNNLDRFYHQKGPRIAKVVRRISCNVEPLEYGVVRAGKLWCDSRAIYPKGFKSRVKYINVVDPSKAYCFYVSEILDAGRDGPLFMVSVEHSPSEVFIHASASRCWEMVRERVNNEISKQHKLGRRNLPPLQPPGSVDGIEMFGFSSPAIMQVIQVNDKNRVCSEYWKSRPLMQIPQQYSKSIDSSKSNSNVKFEPLNDHETEKIQHGVEKTLTGLFKKANYEELHTLYSLLSNKSSIDEKSLLIRLLKEEIHK